MGSLFRDNIAFRIVMFSMLIIGLVVGGATYYVAKERSAFLEDKLLESSRNASVIGAKTIGKILEEASDNGALTIKEIFDNDYQKFGNFEPAKYHTAYDGYMDKAVLLLQDEFLKDENVAYALGVSKDGYVPTHNSRFNKRITGTKADLAGNRTKRMYTDPVAKAAGANEKPGFQQVYHRDTGETLWDISSPIYVKGKHWGTFRVGVSLNHTEQAVADLMEMLGIIFGSAALAAALMVGLIVRSSLMPLSDVSEIAVALVEGDIEDEFEITGSGEFYRLGTLLEEVRVKMGGKTDDDD